MRVSKTSDAQAVGGVQLAEEELAAGIPHPIELQQASSWEQRLGGEQLELEIMSESIVLCLLMIGINSK